MITYLVYPIHAPHTHTLIYEHNFLLVRIVSMTMWRSECINASPDKQ